MNEWIKKKCHTQILCSIRKKEILLFELWVDLKGIVLNEISQIEKDGIILFICELY